VSSRSLNRKFNLNFEKMKKIMAVNLISVLLLVGLSFFTNPARAGFGFTCCPQEKADCIYEGEMVAQDKYYNGTGPCMAGL
jgi:hypothetical protein